MVIRFHGSLLKKTKQTNLQASWVWRDSRTNDANAFVFEDMLNFMSLGN